MPSSSDDSATLASPALASLALAAPTLASPARLSASQPLAAQPPAWLRSKTPARVSLQRTGSSIATPELLDFQLAHARARDAVHAALQPASLMDELRALLKTHGFAASSNPVLSSPVRSNPILLHSAAKDRSTYLQRPDLGRKLDDASRDTLSSLAKTRGGLATCLAIVIADGLSALAIERNTIPLLAELLPDLAQLEPAPALAPIAIVQQGRVAVGDEVAHAFAAQLVIVLIGERPGLSSPDSLGAYITWEPSPGITTDAERNCISNIRSEGLSHSEAAFRLMHYIRQARSQQRTGIALKDPEAPTAARSLQPEDKPDNKEASGQ